MAPTKMKLRVRKKERSSAKPSQQQQESHRPETSPDSKCPICLDRFVNVASVERCLHRFCFRCIREWAKNKAECPLCKQPFRSIFHSVRAENDFKEFVVLEENTLSATTSASVTVTTTAAPIAAASAGPNDTERATRARRSSAMRSRQRWSHRDQDLATSASSMDGMVMDPTTLMQRDPACLRQLLPWLRRERIMGTNPTELRPFLLARTDHILHELVSFARSIEAMQCPPTPSYEEDSGSQSSIINISEDDSEEAEVTENTIQDRVPPVTITTSTISLSQSAWDDETPGPSYSTLSHPQTEEVQPEGNQVVDSSAAPELLEHNHEDPGDEEACMIVGYVKPMAERTPELVQLSSDTTEEEGVGGNEAAATEAVMKVESSLTSQELPPLSPKPYPSTSHMERRENLEQSRELTARKHLHQGRKDRTPRRAFRNPSHSLSGSRSQTSSESSPPSGHSVRTGRSHFRFRCRDSRRQGDGLSGRSPMILAERDVTSSEELVPTRSISAQDKSFSPWDSPVHDSQRRKKKTRKRRRDRETERSRSPHWESRHRRGNRELWLRSSSSSSRDADSRQEKPAGKRKYKTRHLERTARRRSSGKSKERERSPSVEIVFERRASDAHPRDRRRKKKNRRKERAQNSPTVITIDSSDSGANHVADPQNSLTVKDRHSGDPRSCQTETDAHNLVAREGRTENRFIEKDKDHLTNSHNLDYQDHTSDDSEHVTDFSDHTIDYQERLTGFSNRATVDKDNVTDVRDFTRECSDSRIDQNHGSALSDREAASKVLGVSSRTSDYKDDVLEVSDYPADFRHSVTTMADSNSTSTANSKRHESAASHHNILYQRPFLDTDDILDDFQLPVMDIETRGEPSVLDMLNLEHCLVDVVQPIRVADDNNRVATPLSDTRLQEIEDSLLGEVQGTLGHVTVDQQRAGLEAQRDELETEHVAEVKDLLVTAKTLDL